MNKIIIFVIFILLIGSAGAFTYKIGGENIEYDTIYQDDSDFDGVDDRKTYYKGEDMVLAVYDFDNDGSAEMWFTYTDGLYASMAMRDNNGDGKPNDIVTYDKEGKITAEVSKRTFSDRQYIIAFSALVALIAVIYVIIKVKQKKKHIKKEHKKKKPKKI